MGKYSNYKRMIKSNPCYYCDYLLCRKGHKCKYYKKYVKKYSRKIHGI